MSDIIITIPKSVSWETWLAEAEAVEADPDACLNFRVANKPKSAGPGDKCFVVHDGFIRGYHVIKHIADRPGFQCQTTGKHWAPGTYIMRSGKFHRVKPMSFDGFQGWRYFHVGYMMEEVDG